LFLSFSSIDLYFVRSQMHTLLKPSHIESFQSSSRESLDIENGFLPPSN
jgi:hypothetical protein